MACCVAVRRGKAESLSVTDRPMKCHCIEMQRATLGFFVALALALSACDEAGGNDSGALSVDGTSDGGSAVGAGAGITTTPDATTGANRSAADAAGGIAAAGAGAEPDAGQVRASDGGGDGSSGGSTRSDASAVGSDGGGRAADASGSGELSPEQLVPGLDGYLYTGECAGGTASFECPMAGCSGNVFTKHAKFAVGGVATETYSVTLHIYGVVELRADYKGGQRRQATSSNASSRRDFWYSGGAYTAGAGYNVYQLRVTPAVDGIASPAAGGNNYFLNARDGSNEAHEVWEINTEAVVPVKGGGSIEFTAYDPNCLQIMNNAETARPTGSGPSGSIVVDLHEAKPAPVGFTQPLSTNGRNGQWVYLDVVAVSAK